MSSIRILRRPKCPRCNHRTFTLGCGCTCTCKPGIRLVTPKTKKRRP